MDVLDVLRLKMFEVHVSWLVSSKRTGGKAPRPRNRASEKVFVITNHPFLACRVATEGREAAQISSIVQMPETLFSLGPPDVTKDMYDVRIKGDNGSVSPYFGRYVLATSIEQAFEIASRGVKNPEFVSVRIVCGRGRSRLVVGTAPKEDLSEL